LIKARVTATKVGSLKCRVIQVDGSGLDITLHEVKFSTELWVNLFIFNKYLNNEYYLSNKGLSIYFPKGSVWVTYDRVMRITNGSLSGVKLLVNESPVVYSTLSGTFYGKKVAINEFHKMLGHCGSDRWEKNAKIHNSKLNDEFKTCEQYPIDKHKQKNVNKELKGGSQALEYQL
jgi:hypothetical protein